jgi:ankyrin repeat protein
MRRSSVMANNNATMLSEELGNLCNNKMNVPTAAEVQSFIDRGANVNGKDARGYTALDYAVINDYLDAVKTLLAAVGIDIEEMSKYGETAIFLAFDVCCSNEITKALLVGLMKLSPDFDINTIIKGWRTKTLLMFACTYGNVEIVKLLLSTPHINAYMKNEKGFSALEYLRNKDELYDELYDDDIIYDDEHAIHDEFFFHDFEDDDNEKAERTRQKIRALFQGEAFPLQL